MNENNYRTRILTIRLTDEEYELIKAQAIKEQRTVSSMLRVAAMRGLGS